MDIRIGLTQVDGAKWQVVYKAADGRDYCRETYDASWPLDSLIDLVASECGLHGLSGAVIERW